MYPSKKHTTSPENPDEDFDLFDKYSNVPIAPPSRCVTMKIWLFLFFLNFFVETQETCRLMDKGDEKTNTGEGGEGVKDLTVPVTPESPERFFSRLGLVGCCCFIDTKENLVWSTLIGRNETKRSSHPLNPS